ncbi:MAG: preprotein translocase subunit SecE [Candidatus Gracilibacteria bacterium]|jgi:preprotein translocase SecE subunit
MTENSHERKENPIVAYFKSAFEEFGKVTWPTKEQAALLTGIVIGVSLILAIAIGLVDLGFSQGYQYLLDRAPTPESSYTVDPSDIDVTTVPADTPSDTSGTPADSSSTTPTN